MNRKSFMFVCLMLLVSAPLLAQESLYPIRNTQDFVTKFTEDHSSFVVEKAFAYKLTLGSPSKGKGWFLPDSKTPLVALWLRIESLSDQAVELNTSAFTSTGEDGQKYAVLQPEEAFNRIMSGAGDRPVFLTSTLRGISLGRSGPPETAEQLKEDALRYSMQPGRLAAHEIREGYIYFEKPKQKKFTIDVRLGDLWSKSFPFSTSKPK
jgi:hypothetical protein